MTEKELLKLKTRVEDAKESTLKLQGEEEGMLKQLKKDWKCKDLPEAKKKIKTTQKGLDRTDQEIKSRLKALEDKLEAKGDA